MRNGLGRPGITLHHHRLSSTLTFSQRLAEMISSFGKDRKIEKKKLTYSISWKNEKANKRKTFCTHTERERDGDLQTLTLCIHIVVTSQTDRGRYRAASRTCVERERKKREAKVGGRRVCAGFVAWVFIILFFSLLVCVVRVHHCHRHHCHYHHYHYDPHVSRCTCCAYFIHLSFCFLSSV